jgi:hypothetical protein
LYFIEELDLALKIINIDENLLILNSILIFNNLKLEIKKIDKKKSPLIAYDSLKFDRAKLLKDHREKKSGVYCLFNKINGKFYIGCSINLNGRLKIYLNNQ